MNLKCLILGHDDVEEMNNNAAVIVRCKRCYQSKIKWKKVKVVSPFDRKEKDLQDVREEIIDNQRRVPGVLDSKTANRNKRSSKKR